MKKRRANKSRVQPYQAKLLQAAAAGTMPTTPGVYITHIYHEDGCSIWKAGGVCDCDPDIEMEAPAKDQLPEKLKRLMDDNSKIGKE